MFPEVEWHLTKVVPYVKGGNALPKILSMHPRTMAAIVGCETCLRVAYEIYCRGGRGNSSGHWSSPDIMYGRDRVLNNYNVSENFVFRILGSSAPQN